MNRRAARQPLHSARTLCCTLALLLLLSSQGAGAAAAEEAPEPVAFALAEQSLQLDCAAGLLVITWITADESNVAAFKVHRLSLDGQEPNRWVNPFALVARGAGSTYRVADADLLFGPAYRYRLYGFDDDFLLSRAKQVVLADRLTAHCRYLPVVARF